MFIHEIRLRTKEPKLVYVRNQVIKQKLVMRIF